MLRPTDIEKLKGNKSRYAVVVGVAKLAREIAEKAEQDGVILLQGGAARLNHFEKVLEIPVVFQGFSNLIHIF